MIAVAELFAQYIAPSIAPVVSATVVGIIVGWKTGRAKLAQWDETVNKVDRLAADMEIVRREVTVDHGQSVKDEVIAQGNQLATLNAMQMLCLSNCGQIVAMLDADGTVLSVSQAYTDVTGLTAEECADDRWLAQIRADERDHVADRWREAQRLGVTYAGQYHHVHARTGREVFVDCRCVPVKRNGVVVSWTARMRIIGERQLEVRT